MDLSLAMDMINNKVKFGVRRLILCYLETIEIKSSNTFTIIYKKLIKKATIVAPWWILTLSTRLRNNSIHLANAILIKISFNKSYFYRRSKLTISYDIGRNSYCHRLFSMIPLNANYEFGFRLLKYLHILLPKRSKNFTRVTFIAKITRRCVLF